MTEEDIHDLIQRSAKGDRTAFRDLVEEFQQYAFSLAFRLLCNKDNAEEAVQLSFVKTWEHIDSYDPRRKFSTWFYAIVNNTCLDMLRARKRASTDVESIDESEESHEIPDAAHFEDLLDISELATIIEQLTGRLPMKQRSVFTLRDLQGLSIAEVVETLGMSEASVKTNLVFARRHVREMLDRLYHVKGM